MSDKKKILYITFNMPWQGGGTFYRVFGFAKFLVQMGHEVTVLAPDLDSRWGMTEEFTEGVRIMTSPSLLFGKLRTGWDPYEILWRLWWLRGEEFDIVHAFETRPTIIYPALYASRPQRTSLFFDWCDWFGRGGIIEERDRLTKLILGPVETFFEENFRQRAVGTTVINTLLEKRAIDLGVSADSIRWIPNGTSTKKIVRLDKTESRQALGLPVDETPIVGYLGHAFSQDAELLGNSFTRLLEDFPQAKLVVIGGYRGTIPQHIPNKDSLIVTGYVSVDDMNRYLCSCDVLLLPLCNTLANRGRWPMKINDYMCSGRPIVSTDVGDWQRLFKREDAVGLLAKPTAESIATQCKNLISDQSYAEQLGKNGRYIAEKEFDWPLITENLAQFYREQVKKII